MVLDEDRGEAFHKNHNAPEPDWKAAFGFRGAEGANFDRSGQDAGLIPREQGGGARREGKDQKTVRTSAGHTRGNCRERWE